MMRKKFLKKNINEPMCFNVIKWFLWDTTYTTDTMDMKRTLDTLNMLVVQDDAAYLLNLISFTAIHFCVANTKIQ